MGMDVYGKKPTSERGWLVVAPLGRLLRHDRP
jgi:hypothetical protein